MYDCYSNDCVVGPSDDTVIRRVIPGQDRSQMEEDMQMSLASGLSHASALCAVPRRATVWRRAVAISALRAVQALIVRLDTEMEMEKTQCPNK